MKNYNLPEICVYLGKNDPTLALILDANLECPVLLPPAPRIEDKMERLMKIIVGQQLSTVAATSIWEKFRSNEESFNSFLRLISSIDVAEKNPYGISRQKLKTLQELIKQVNEGIIDFEQLKYMNDSEIYTRLTRIRGIGVWTVDMFLMSCLKRLDVFSEHDAGLVRAISKLYKLPTVCKDDIKSIASKWSPYRSVACWFLWRALDEKRI